MGSPSKERDIAELFFNNAAKHWHFEEILNQTGISRSKASKWLSRLTNENIIKRVKPRKKMPHYVANFDHPSYRNKKKLHTHTRFYETGFLDHLLSLPKAKTVILFGSFSRADWYEDSDIDVFIFGSDEGFEKIRYECKLHHDIQIFSAQTKKDLKKFGSDLIHNILKGDLIKGELDFVEVNLHA